MVMAAVLVESAPAARHGWGLTANSWTAPWRTALSMETAPTVSRWATEWVHAHLKLVNTLTYSNN